MLGQYKPVGETHQGILPAALVEIAVLLLASLPALASESAASPGVQCSSVDRVTRISIEMGGKFHYLALGRLRNPDRLYFDLLALKSAGDRQRALAIPVTNKLVKRIRVAQRERGITRVVLDLQKPVAFVSSGAANSDRFLIELHDDAAADLPTPMHIAAPKGAETRNEALRLPGTQPQSAGPVRAVTAVLQPGIASVPRQEAVQAVRGSAPSASLHEAGQGPAARSNRLAVIKPAHMQGLLVRAARDGSVSATYAPAATQGSASFDVGHKGIGARDIDRTGVRQEDLVLNVAYGLGGLVKDRAMGGSINSRSGRTALELPNAVKAPERDRVESIGLQHAGLKTRPDPRFEPATHPRVLLEQPIERDSTAVRSLTRALGLKVGRVILDAGHGGDDSGAVGRGGLKEKDLVLDVARRLGSLIEKHGNSEVIYTRSGDNFVPLEARPALAEEKRADLFVSIHANWSASHAAAGPETYYLNFTRRDTSLDVAARENASSQKSIDELEGLLEAIALNEKVNESRALAGSVESSLYNSLSAANAEEKNRGVKQAPFLVLIGSRVPSILVEIGFLSNPHEENLLKGSDYRQRIADALYGGVARYMEKLSYFEVAQRD